MLDALRARFGGGTVAPSISMQLADLAAAEDTARSARFARAWRMYYGEHPKPLRVTSGHPLIDDNVTLNFARVVVNKGVAFLFGAEVGFELVEGETTPAEAWLDAVWAANRKATLLQKLALNGGVCGHTFVKMVPSALGGLPRLIVLDPSTVSVRWEPDDLERVASYRVQYPARDPRTGRVVTRRQVIERDGAGWTITDQESRGDSLAWTTLSEAVWRHDFAPIVDCQNLPAPNEYWGISDLEDDVIGLNQSANLVLSNLARIVRFHAHPKTWGKGFAAQQLSVAVDETIVLPSPDASLQNLEMRSDLASSIELYKRLKEALHEVVQVPEVATGKVDSLGALSGVALAILYQPLIEKTEGKRRTYGDLLVELNRRLLALGGYGEDNVIHLQWPELLPADPLAERQVALLDQQLGASQATILERLGYNVELEVARRAEEQANAGEQMLAAFDRGAGEPPPNGRGAGRGR